MLYTQYFTGLLLACLFFYSIFQRKPFRIPALWWLVAAIAIVIAFTPWLAKSAELTRDATYQNERPLLRCLRHEMVLGDKNVCRPKVGAGLLDSLRANLIPAASATDSHQAQGRSL
jgi:hypothetical protein